MTDDAPTYPLGGDGDAVRCARIVDWARTSAGPVSAWSAQMATLVAMVLGSRHPMFLAWGSDRVLIYNDAMIPLLGGRHPWSLGRPVPETWPALDELLHRARAGDDGLELSASVPSGQGTDQASISVACTLIHDAEGGLAGLLGTCRETDDSAATRRQYRLLDQAPGFISVMTGVDHVVSFVSNTHRTRFDSAGWIGRPARDVLPPEMRGELLQCLDHVLHTGEQSNTHFRSAPDRQHCLHVGLTALRDANGAVSGVIFQGQDIAQAAHIEAAMHEGEQRFVEIANAAPALIWTSDPTGGCNWFNNLWLSFTGRSVEEQLGDGWASAVHPDDMMRCLAIYRRAVSGRQSFRMDYRLRRADGVYRLVDDTGVPRFTRNGTYLGHIGCCFDVTDQRATEQALRGSEEQLRLATEFAEVGLWDVHILDDTLYWPARVKAMFGISADSPVSMRDFYAGLHPEDGEQVSQAFAAACDPVRRAIYDVEYRTIGKEDGVVRWVAAKGRGMFDESGRCVRVIGIALDITRRKRTEAQLRQFAGSLERLVAERTAERDRVWRNSRDLLVVLDLDGSLRAANPAWTRVLGQQTDDVIGHNLLDFAWPDDRAALQTMLLDARAGARRDDLEIRCRHTDGTPRWVSWHASVAGELIFAYGRDVTAEKEQSTALLAAEDQLRQAQKMEAVGQLTGGLAHDFNNLLTGIAGSLELLKGRLAQNRMNDVERYISSAEGATRRAAVLTHRLLAFSRRQTLDPKPLLANRLVAEMEELIRRTIGPSIKLEVREQDAPWTILADPNQLENAVLNLCINARDAMPDGGLLSVATENIVVNEAAGRALSLDPGAYVAISVADTGVGMPPDVIARAFDPFYTTKPIGSGTGLGLSMIYGFAKQSGGQVRITSEVGRGTQVCLYMPRHLGEARVDDAPTRSGAVPRAREGETVLVVDDEETVRMLVIDVLEDLGYAAIEAGDGQAALKVMQSDRRIDLLVTDVGLPGGMNGRQVADAGRALRPTLKVLFITGYAESSVIGSGSLAKGMQVLTKPFPVNELAARMKELIGSG